MAIATTWRCENRGCSHPFSKAWHRGMAERILANAGPETVLDFEAAHPDPDLAECDDCYRVGGSHDPRVEH